MRHRTAFCAWGHLVPRCLCRFCSCRGLFVWGQWFLGIVRGEAGGVSCIFRSGRSGLLRAAPRAYPSPVHPAVSYLCVLFAQCCVASIARIARRGVLVLTQAAHSFTFVHAFAALIAWERVDVQPFLDRFWSWRCAVPPCFTWFCVGPGCEALLIGREPRYSASTLAYIVCALGIFTGDWEALAWYLVSPCTSSRPS